MVISRCRIPLFFVVVGILFSCALPIGAQEKAVSKYLDTAVQVIKENNKIDADIAAALQSASLRPIHRVESLQKANKDAYAMWPDLFNSQVPDQYADLYVNLKKLVKLQMKRTCLIYDSEYTAWMVNRDKARPYREELMAVDERYKKQKALVNKIYDTVK
jgi:hypothetical protein